MNYLKLSEYAYNIPKEFSPIIERIRQKRQAVGFDDGKRLTHAIFAQALWDIGVRIGKSRQKNYEKIVGVLDNPGKRALFFRRMLTDTWGETKPNRHVDYDENAYNTLLELKPQLASIRFLDVGSSRSLGAKGSPASEDTVKFFRERGVQVEAVAIDTRIAPGMDGKTHKGVKYFLQDARDDSLLRLGEFDYILCTNVLCYHDEKVARQIIQRLEDMMADPGVFLFDPKLEVYSWRIKSNGKMTVQDGRADI